MLSLCSYGNKCNRFFFHLVEQSHIALLAFLVCLSSIYLHLSYAQFSFYGLKIVLTSDLESQQNQNETWKFSTLHVSFLKTQGLEQSVVLKLLANIKWNISSPVGSQKNQKLRQGSGPSGPIFVASRVNKIFTHLITYIDVSI